MSVRRYGIFLAYAPTVDLRHEGLGRYLSAFLKGAAEREEVRFVLVCPSWSRAGLEKLFETERVPMERIDISSPDGKPLVLRGYEVYKRLFPRSDHALFRHGVRASIADWCIVACRAFERRLVRAHSFHAVLPILLGLCVLAFFAAILSPVVITGVVLLMLRSLLRPGLARLAKPLLRPLSRLKRLLGEPKENSLVVRLYQHMELAEAERMLQLIQGLPNVNAWYCPTAFWPAFNNIRAPKLMCVPDVVLTDFPVGFSDVGGDRFLANFESIESSIRSGQYFVTYSESVKWETLVDRYAIRAANISVVHHAPNDLSRWVEVSGFDDAEATSQHYCESLFKSALRKSFNPAYADGFSNGSAKFLFYASQFRPNKNLISLLKAYEYLLRRRFIGHKLILTGNPRVLPAVKRFIKDHGLKNDVLCLHGLTIQELAACYKLADLAVNPSLSEGGCPFTFTEALSVGTPVVMARIPVTEEVLTDPELQSVTLFDPYDWKDMASRIEWALGHREQLLVVQRRTYVELSKRSWADVVNEHIEILERISTSSDPAMTVSGA